MFHDGTASISGVTVCHEALFLKTGVFKPKRDVITALEGLRYASYLWNNLKHNRIRLR
jgi:hypothetical protein